MHKVCKCIQDDKRASITVLSVASREPAAGLNSGGAQSHLVSTYPGLAAAAQTCSTSQGSPDSGHSPSQRMRQASPPFTRPHATPLCIPSRSPPAPRHTNPHNIREPSG